MPSQYLSNEPNIMYQRPTFPKSDPMIGIGQNRVPIFPREGPRLRTFIWEHFARVGHIFDRFEMLT